jgi:HD-GYP domain-containing protein (c-di-GMP phosphodiesterase class II)
LVTSCPVGAQEEKESRYQLLHRIGVALSAEQNRDRLLDLILTEAQSLCQADGGTLYLRTEDDRLAFEIVKNASLNIEIGGVSGKPVPFPPLPLFDASGRPNRSNVATFAAHEKRLVHIPDAYDSEKFDFSGTKAFDQKSGYRSKSFLTIPLINSEGLVIGVIQLLNAQGADGTVISFDAEHQQIVAALASQAAIALDNKLLMEAQKNLLESFIKLIAAAIDAKSPYTGGHCERVPVITEMLMGAVCDTTEGPFADFHMTEDERYELHIAAWLHDCGKVTTPVHVMDKSTKLETIFDRIEIIRARFEILKRDAKIAYLDEIVAGADRAAAKERYDTQIRLLTEDLNFLETANIGGEFLPPEAQARITQMGEIRFQEAGQTRRLLDDEEISNLSISRGTLTEDERLIINGHMVQTARMLDALPFPRNLRKVPEYASGHHEKMDGGGYPRGILAQDMSVPARAMAIADVFEALTADDRPYKKAKKLSEAMRIMGFMKKDNHLDPELFDLFVSSGVYRKYAERHLSPALLDEVDEQALLAITPKPFDLPPKEERDLRKTRFLPEYEERFPARNSQNPLAITPMTFGHSRKAESS